MRFFVLPLVLLIALSFSTPYLSLMDKHVSLDLNFELKPSLDIFTGDFPYIISYNDKEAFEFYLKLYEMFYMLPQDTNTYIKIGKNLEIGYIDEYSSSTPLYQAYFGKDANYYFGLTSKIKNTNFGAKFYFNQNPEFYFGLHNKYINLYLDYQKSLDFELYYRIKDFYTLNFKYNDNSIYFGLGISWFSKNYYDIPKENCKYLAHRGQLNKYPENSQIAFENTIKDGKYIGTELDVNKTKDGHYAVIHDPLMFRFTGNIKFISQYNMKELEKIDISYYFHYKTPVHVLELKDVAKIFENSNKIIQIEVKSCGSTKKDVEKFLNYVDEYFPENETVWFSSLDSYWVKELKKLNHRKNTKVFYIYPFLMVSQSDYVYPLIDSEFKNVIKDVHADGIIWFKPKADLFEKIQSLSKKYKIDMLYWDFADEIYYYEYSK